MKEVCPLMMVQVCGSRAVEAGLTARDVLAWFRFRQGRAGEEAQADGQRQVRSHPSRLLPGLHA